LGAAAILLMYLAATEYASTALLCCLPWGFRGWELWAVVAYEEVLELTLSWEAAQKKKHADIPTDSSFGIILN